MAKTYKMLVVLEIELCSVKLADVIVRDNLKSKKKITNATPDAIGKYLAEVFDESLQYAFDNSAMPYQGLMAKSLSATWFEGMGPK